MTRPASIPPRGDGGRGSMLTHAIVALASLALGVAGTWLAVRREWAPSPPAPAAGGPSEHEGMPGMASEPSAEHPTEATGSTVHISPARQQLIGVRTAPVTARPLRTTIRTVGTLAYDETRVTRINTKIAGWIDRVYVDYVGKSVRHGDPLLALYSPALVATQKEYLLALEGGHPMGDSASDDPWAASDSLRTATRERLKLWDVSDAQIAEIERTRQVRRLLTLYAPFDGVVLERGAFAGQYITPETTTFKIADLSTIWVLGQIFEYELGRVKIGQEVTVEFPYGQAPEGLTGAITFIYPEVDPQTRRVKIRAEFRNPGLEFKPDTYVTLVIAADQGEALSVPKEALIDTGAKRYVILAHPNGYFEPREVEVGPPTDEVYPVTRGLEEGDTIVTSALFLVDSETNLQAAMQAMSMSMPGMDMGGSKRGDDVQAPQPREGEHSGHPAPATEP